MGFSEKISEKYRPSNSFYQAFKEERSGNYVMKFAVTLFSLLNFYIVSAWSVWYYGGSLGIRALVQSYPVWAFALAAMLAFIGEKRWKIAVAAPCARALLCCQFMVDSRTEV